MKRLNFYDVPIGCIEQYANEENMLVNRFFLIAAL